MADLFNSIRRKFSGDDARRAIVRGRFQEAMESGVKLELRALNSMQPQDQMIVLSIASMGDDHFVVGQPKAEVARLLKAKVTYSIGLYFENDHWVGETTCFGRYKYQDEQNRTIYTHRFSLPTDLQRDEPSCVPRDSTIIFKDQDVELNAFELRSPIHGVTIDLKRRQARLQCHNATNKLHVGQDVYLKTELPHPVGPIADLVRIVRLEPMPDSPSYLVDVTFHTPISKFDELVDRMKAMRQIRKAG